ncbi:MAG: A24 family peptidase [Lachnospiraceae bacterium]|nr:A24 family peptidase [Agathobacter sp.]MDD6290585.1 A24 family peptidase [Lachnospiraceae bacterium]
MQEKIRLARLLIPLMGLAVLGIEDLRKKQISSWPMVFMGGVGVVLSFIGNAWNDWIAVLSFLPGCVTLLFAWITKESIGYGDGLVLLCLGCFLTAVQMVNLCMIAISIAGIVALFLLLIKKQNRKAQIPFVPFLFVGYVVLILV